MFGRLGAKRVRSTHATRSASALSGRPGPCLKSSSLIEHICPRAQGEWQWRHTFGTRDTLSRSCSSVVSSLDRSNWSAVANALDDDEKKMEDTKQLQQEVDLFSTCSEESDDDYSHKSPLDEDSMFEYDLDQFMEDSERDFEDDVSFDSGKGARRKAYLSRFSPILSRESRKPYFSHCSTLERGEIGREILELLKDVDADKQVSRQREIEQNRRLESIKQLVDSLNLPLSGHSGNTEELITPHRLSEPSREAAYSGAPAFEKYQVQLTNNSERIAPAVEQYGAWLRSMIFALKCDAAALSAKTGLTKQEKLLLPTLRLVPAKVLAAVVLQHVFQHVSDQGTVGMPVASLAARIGQSANQHLQAGAATASSKMNVYNRVRYDAEVAGGSGRYAAGGSRMSEHDRATWVAMNPQHWDMPNVVMLGAALIEVMCESCFVQRKFEDLSDEEAFEKQQESSSQEPAFFFSHAVANGGKRRTGVILLHPGLSLSIANPVSMQSLSALHEQHVRPMIVPPKDWTTPFDGGYLDTRFSLLRVNEGAGEAFEALDKVPCPEVLDALNKLGATPWMLNKRVYALAKRVKQEDLGVTGLPIMSEANTAPLNARIAERVPYLTKQEMSDPVKLKKLKDVKARKEKARRIMQQWASKHLDFQAKLDLAKFCEEHDTFWFPYSLDFRGRAYPVPPVSHMGDDLARALLQFRVGRKLGTRGFYWLKVHFANQMGFDKAPMDERAKWTEERMESVVLKAYKSPVNENDPTLAEAWARADNPWQAFACACEIAKALEHPDGPEEYVSHLPVHQDGSCNGLQHYAALGRDLEGGIKVNLVNSERPGDVYSAVSDVVRERIKEVAQGYDGVAQNYEECNEEQKAPYLAHKVKDMITRKLVKQTTMTKVYGVTFVGARMQIEKRLDEMNEKNLLAKSRGEPLLGNIITDEEIFALSRMLATETLKAIETTFKSAAQIQNWLGVLANLCTTMQQPLAWVTPLGLPVTQVYRKRTNTMVITSMQRVSILDFDKEAIIDKIKQRNAFPPNYVHSIDSTHMLLTARECFDQGITFASVHDSFWTHASDIDKMSIILREQFINLHKDSLLHDLRNQFVARFPQMEHEIPEPPFEDTLDLRKVRDSLYFFS